ncbi:hypothetical protein PHYC_03011 [Phycisphaerales bacterium]|nr:hypothetical protein PHYC_03011 [Phycisphaerales bacterium]
MRLKANGERRAHGIRSGILIMSAAAIVGLPISLAACSKTESHTKEKTVTTRESPTETKKTTETTEKKVETTPK